MNENTIDILGNSIRDYIKRNNIDLAQYKPSTVSDMEFHNMKIALEKADSFIYPRTFNTWCRELKLQPKLDLVEVTV